jgi:hypothetical protein
LKAPVIAGAFSFLDNFPIFRSVIPSLIASAADIPLLNAPRAIAAPPGIAAQ